MRWKFFVVLLCLLLAIADAKQRSKTRRPKLASDNRPIELRGSKEQRVQQNTKAINLGIGQILTDKELLNMESGDVLIGLKDTRYYSIHKGATRVRKLRRGKKIIVCLPKKSKILVRRCVKSYIDLFARDFFSKFHKKLEITSGARSLEEQILMRTKGSCTYNPNAAIASNPLEESLHVRALAFDISRRVIVVVKGRSKAIPMSTQEIAWIRKYLIVDKLKGVEFEEEGQEVYSELETQPIEEDICFHIAVFPK